MLLGAPLPIHWICIPQPTLNGLKRPIDCRYLGLLHGIINESKRGGDVKHYMVRECFIYIVLTKKKSDPAISSGDSLCQIKNSSFDV